MSTPTPETLRRLVEQWRVRVERDQRLASLLYIKGEDTEAQEVRAAALSTRECADDLAALLDTAPPALTREQAEAKLTPERLRRMMVDLLLCSIDASLRTVLLDALYGPAQPTDGRQEEA